MKSFPPEKIRNVALVGHGGAGKTTLAEALLLEAGVINRQGRIEDGNTVSDYEPEETKRQISVALSLLTFEYGDHKINLLDVPGYADFFPEVHAAFSVADLVVFVVSAVDGVEVQTVAAWKLAEELQLPRLIFVNKIDRDRASWQRTLDQLRDAFGQTVVPLELPLGEESQFHGVADLLTDTAIVYDSGHAEKTEVPPEIADEEHQAHDTLVEGIVVGDEELMEHYLEGEEPTFDELERTLAHEVADCLVFPVIVGSAAKDIAIDRLAQFICEIGTAPCDRPGVLVEAGTEAAEVKCDPDGQPLAYVFKTISDPYVGKISLFKVLSGRIRPDDHLVNSRTKGDERLHALFSLRGKEQLSVSDVVAGDIGAVAKLTDTSTGDTLAPKGSPVVVPPPPRPRPSQAVAINPKSKGDEDKLMSALHRLQDEDPSIEVRRDDETHQTVIAGLGDTHLAITLERLSRKFGVEVDTEDVKVPYRETISASSDAEGKYKKQTGGHGQFGVATIKMEPLERGEGFQFVDKIVGGAIPRQFIPAVEKGIQETMSSGGHFGYPVVDVKVTLVDGKYHPVDSSEMSFKMAGSLAFKEALAKANPVLLEPVSHIEVTVPIDAQGDIMGDINGRRGRVQNTDLGGSDTVTITALVPTSELQRYASDLRSMTGGRGSFTAEHDHYDVLPQHLYTKVAKQET